MLKQIKQEIKNLAKQTDKTKSSNFFKSYLNTMSKFYNYSHKNQLLIHHQKPNSTRVAGYQTWKKLKRKVKKGETAIKILAPIIINKEDKETITAFKPVNVFDISQTKGKPLPNINIDMKGNNKNLLNKFITYCNNNNIKLTFKNLSKSLYGYTQNNSITINHSKPTNTQINTLIHEIAHSILHQNSKLTKQQKEIQAEAVAYVICKHFNLNPKSFNYLALYEADYKKIMDNLETVSKCVKSIVDKL